ncbi:MAG: type II CRISPR RNA-guided endonuclease Cas9 [Hyphomicrobiaceae bacterium]|nr:type II CRISPR RNA-guided endonuclease Cas9 [Hyphomicrobiaceae bacterium]
MKWRLGFDIGTNSIGWAVLELDTGDVPKPKSLLECGVRIFSDGRNPKDKQSLAAARRLPRGQRRNRDRYILRRRLFMEKLVELGLMPSDTNERKELEKLDPWELRVNGLDKELSLFELGRALFHLQQHRGFKSNRKLDAGSDDESGKIKNAANKVESAMKATNARTFGKLLASPRVDNPKTSHEHPVRARLNGTGAKAEYDFYPTRKMIEDEFNALWQFQQPIHAAQLTEENRAELIEIMLFQRPLKAQPVGKCSLSPEEERGPKALPSFQSFRIYQELNNLTIRPPGEAARPLTKKERDKLATKLMKTGKVSFVSMKNRSLLDIGTEARFNLESPKRKELDGHQTAKIMEKCWGKSWYELSDNQQEAVIEILIGQERLRGKEQPNPTFNQVADSVASSLNLPQAKAQELLETSSQELLANWLSSHFQLPLEQARNVANAPGDKKWPQGHGNLGRTATRKILLELQNDLITYAQAVEKAFGRSHSQLDDDGERFKYLPYYGAVLERHVAFGTGDPKDKQEKRLGRLANPTVHVALNQIRRVVNALVKRYGEPAQIVVELARDLPLSAEGKKKLEKEQKDNQEANEERKLELEKAGQQNNYENRLRLRLWKELNPDDILARKCPYTSEQIGINNLFDPEVEIEHILPFSRTLDDGIGNKTLCMRRANHFKGGRSPHEAFSDSPNGYDWDLISSLSANLPPNKSWRFGPDAMQRFEDEERDFLARQLNETRYISRLTKIYLERTGAKVWVTPGRLTSDLRHQWGLNSVLTRGHNQPEAEAEQVRKNRNDHRHHAIDAVVIAMTDEGLLNKIARLAGLAEQEQDRPELKLIKDLDRPWPSFRDDVAQSIGQIIVSHKPDHGVQGALHNDTAYGLVTDSETGKAPEVVHRIPLASIDAPAKLALIRDEQIKKHLILETQGLTGKAFKEALSLAATSIPNHPPVRKVRIIENLTVIPITDKKTGKAYKGYKGDGNYCYEIFMGDREKWSGEVITRFDANQKGFDPNAKTSRCGKPLLMRIRQHDILAIEETNQKKFMRVVKFSTGQIILADHYEAGSLKKRNEDKEDLFKYLSTAPSSLQKLDARIVHVDPSGKLYDPGPIK